MGNGEGLSSYEKSDYFGMLAAILEALNRAPEAVEFKKRAEELFAQGERESAEEE